MAVEGKREEISRMELLCEKKDFIYVAVTMRLI
jgi:hypothetical protein